MTRIWAGTLGLTGAFIAISELAIPGTAHAQLFSENWQDGTGAWATAGTKVCKPTADGASIVLTSDATTCSQMYQREILPWSCGRAFSKPGIPVVGGAKYCLSAWVRGSTGTRPFVGIRLSNEAGTPGAEHWLIGSSGFGTGYGGDQVTPITSNGAWHWYTKTFTLEASASFVVLENELWDGGGAGTADFDDLRLYQGECPTTPDIPDAACSGATPVCNVTNNQCVKCDGDLGGASPAACPTLANPHCQSTGACGQCTTNADCSGVPGNPICNKATGACGLTCSGDSDCNTGSWCNNLSMPTSGTCQTQIANGQPVTSNICVPTIAKRACVSGVCDLGNNLCGFANGGGPCNEDSTLCQSGVCSLDNFCGKKDGESCATPTVCRSGQCTAGQCGTGQSGIGGAAGSAGALAGGAAGTSGVAGSAGALAGGAAGTSGMAGSAGALAGGAAGTSGSGGDQTGAGGALAGGAAGSAGALTGGAAGNGGSGVAGTSGSQGDVGGSSGASGSAQAGFGGQPSGGNGGNESQAGASASAGNGGMGNAGAGPTGTGGNSGVGGAANEMAAGGSFSTGGNGGMQPAQNTSGGDTVVEGGAGCAVSPSGKAHRVMLNLGLLAGVGVALRRFRRKDRR